MNFKEWIIEDWLEEPRWTPEDFLEGCELRHQIKGSNEEKIARICKEIKMRHKQMRRPLSCYDVMSIIRHTVFDYDRVWKITDRSKEPGCDGLETWNKCAIQWYQTFDSFIQLLPPNVQNGLRTANAKWLAKHWQEHPRCDDTKMPSDVRKFVQSTPEKDRSCDFC